MDKGAQVNIRVSLELHVRTKHRLPPVLHTSYTRTVHQPHYAQMSSQGVMSSKGAGNNPGLHPVKGQWPSISSRNRAQGQGVSLFLSAGKILLPCFFISKKQSRYRPGVAQRVPGN